MVAVPPRQLSKMVYLHWKRLNIYSRADLPYPLINKTAQLLCNKVHISIRSSKTSKPRNYFNFGLFASIVVRAAIVRRLCPPPAHLAPERCVCPAGVARGCDTNLVCSAKLKLGLNRVWQNQWKPKKTKATSNKNDNGEISLLDDSIHIRTSWAELGLSSGRDSKTAKTS